VALQQPSSIATAIVCSDRLRAYDCPSAGQPLQVLADRRLAGCPAHGLPPHRAGSDVGAQDLELAASGLPCRRHNAFRSSIGQTFGGPVTFSSPNRGRADR